MTESNRNRNLTSPSPWRPPVLRRALHGLVRAWHDSVYASERMLDPRVPWDQGS